MTRIYIAEPSPSKMPTAAKVRLVEAGNPAQVRLHVTKDLYTIRVASAKETAQLMSGQGIQVETPSSGDPDTPELPGVTAAPPLPEHNPDPLPAVLRSNRTGAS